jgi:hypothetical protein
MALKKYDISSRTRGRLISDHLYSSVKEVVGTVMLNTVAILLFMLGV